MQSWLWTYHTYNPKMEAQRAQLCALDNGLIGTHHGPYWQTLCFKIGQNGSWLPFALEPVVCQQNILPSFAKLAPSGLKQSLTCQNILLTNDILLKQYYLELNLQAGLLKKRVLIENTENKQTDLLFQVFVHAKYPNRAAMQMILTPKNWSGEITIHAALEKASEFKVEKTGTEHQKEMIYLALSEKDSKELWSVSSTLKAFIQNTQQKLAFSSKKSKQGIMQTATVQLPLNTPITFEKMIYLEKLPKTKKVTTPKQIFNTLNALSFAGDFQTHQVTWQNLWRNFGISLIPLSSQNTKSDENHHPEQRLLRLFTFQLLQHKTHLLSVLESCFVLPTLRLRNPEISKSILNDLMKMPFEGQMAYLPALVCYELWQYYLSTNDKAFLENELVLFFLKTAKFLSSEIKYINSEKSYEIQNIMPIEAPLETQKTSQTTQNNHAFTTLLAKWVFKKLPEIFQLLPKPTLADLKKSEKLTKAILNKWEKQATHLKAIENSKVLTFFELHFLHFLGLANAYVPEKKISPFQKQTLRKTLLSNLLFAYNTYDSNLKDSRMHYLNALKVIFDSPPTLSEMGAALNIVYFKYFGITLEQEALCFSPKLPTEIKTLELYIQAKGQGYRLLLDHEGLTLELAANHKKVMKVKVFEKYYRIPAGTRFKVSVT